MGKKINMPIMSKEDERFMAFTSLIQWTQGVIAQSKRIMALDEEMFSNISRMNYSSLTYARHCEEHYFVIAANKLIEHCRWVRELNLCTNIDFSEIDSYPSQVINDMRNMREHVVDYFKGDGKVKERWVFETPIYSADASSRINNLLGGRLDFVQFSDAAKRLLVQLEKEPIPFPQKD